MTTYKFNRPAQYSSFEVLIIGKLTTFQNFNSINDRHAAIEFAAKSIVLEVLFRKKKGKGREKEMKQGYNKLNKTGLVHCDTTPRPPEAYPLQQNAQSAHL